MATILKTNTPGSAGSESARFGWKTLQMGGALKMLYIDQRPPMSGALAGKQYIYGTEVLSTNMRLPSNGKSVGLPHEIDCIISPEIANEAVDPKGSMDLAQVSTMRQVFQATPDRPNGLRLFARGMDDNMDVGNRWTMPYSPLLSTGFGAYTNVEHGNPLSRSSTYRNMKSKKPQVTLKNFYRRSKNNFLEGKIAFFKKYLILDTQQ